MKTTVTLIGLLATLAANGQTPFTAEVKWWPATNWTLPSGPHNMPIPLTVPMPPAPVLTTDWETNSMFGGKEIGFRSDGVVVWRTVKLLDLLTGTNGYSYSLTNSNVESPVMTNRNVMTNGCTYYTNIILGDILDNATKPGDLFRASRNGDPIYISLEGVTNLVQLCNKIGHVWKYTNLKNRRCILCDKLVTLWEEWE